MNHSSDLKRIGDIFTVAIGGTPSRKRPEFWDSKKEGSNIWLSIRDISQNKGLRIVDSLEYISNEGVKSSNVKAIPKNTALMTFKLTIGKTVVSDTDLYTNEAIAAFLPKPGIEADPYYLATILPTLSYETDQAVKGATLNKAKIEDTFISLPEISVQKRIAQILSSVDDSINFTQSTLDESKNLKKSLMRQLFTRGIGHTKFKQAEIGEIPEKWEVVELSQVAKVIDSLHKTPRFVKDGIAMVRVSDIKPGNLKLDETLKVSEEDYSYFTTNYIPKKNDIVLSRVGSYGISSFVNNDEKFCMGQNTVVISPKINNRFLFYFLNSEIVWSKIEKEVSGTGYKSLSLSSIKKLKIILPVKDEQEKIAEILESIDNQIEINKKLKVEQEQLKNGLMQDLLTGKVAV